MKKSKHTFNQILVGIAALVLSSFAAYFSVFGLSHLFGSGLPATILFGALEFGKIVAVTYLYNYWKSAHWIRKSFFIFVTFVVMVLTSSGIYGFLSSEYKNTSTDIQIIQNQVTIIEKKQEVFSKQIVSIESQIEFRNDRIISLSDLRSQQETRLDTLYQRQNWYSAKATEDNIKEANLNIDVLNTEILDFNTQISSLTDSIGKYDIEILYLNSNETNSELNSFQYVSDLTKIPMDKLVNYLLLMIILVFDPLAIMFLISFNHIGSIKNKEKEEPQEPKIKKKRWQKLKYQQKQKPIEPEIIPEVVENATIKPQKVKEVVLQKVDVEPEKVEPKVIEKPIEPKKVEIETEVENEPIVNEIVEVVSQVEPEKIEVEPEKIEVEPEKIEPKTPDFWEPSKKPIIFKTKNQ